MVTNKETSSIVWTEEAKELTNALAHSIVKIAHTREISMPLLLGALEFVKYRLMQIADSHFDPADISDIDN